MGDTSLYAGLYEQIRDYAELIDDVLIGLKLGTSTPNDANRQKLGKFLVSLADKHSDDLLTQRIALILSVESKTDRSTYLNLGNALLNAGIDSPTIELLERLAWSLEEQQVRVMAKLRWGMR